MTVYRLLLSIHIAAGFTALLAALVAVVTTKGARAHVYAGRAFVVGMALVFGTALPMTVIKPNLFLLLVAIFSFYLALTGWLRARNRRGIPAPSEWVAASAMMLATPLGRYVALAGVHLKLMLAAWIDVANDR